VTVHIDKSGHVYMSKNRAVPASLLPETFISRVTKKVALIRARRSLPKRGGHAVLHDSERVWFPYRKSLLPAWKFRLVRKKPRQDWIVYVNTKTGHVLSRYDNLSQSKPARGLVFDPSPVIALGDHSPLMTGNEVRRPPVDAYREVPLLGLDDGGFLSGDNVSTILHELGHAIQDAICPDFGQSAEAAAMGEGFGDYWAASNFESKNPDRYRASVMTWDGLLLGMESKLKPPSLRRLDSKKTFEDFDKPGDEHDNGEIWSATLWDVRKELGQEASDRVVLESHFQLDGFTTFARGARAILDADRNLESGRHVAALRRIFRKRKIGPL
jgi:hypothetical protein